MLDGKRRLIRGGRSIDRISNDIGPQDPVDDDGLNMSAAREFDVPRGRIAPLTEASVPPVGTTVACARLDYSDSYVPDCCRRMRGLGSHRLGPLYIVLGWIVLIFVYLIVFQNYWSPYAIRRKVCLLMLM